MHVLFVHKNYPAQFGHIAAYLAEHKGFQCTFLSEREPGTAGGVRRIQYGVRGGATRRTHYCSRSFENYTWHSHAVYETLKAHPEIRPDLVVGHSGFGSTVFLADLYGCPIINYFEYFYHPSGADMNFRPEFPARELDVLRSRTRNAMLLLDLQSCTAGYSPTNWQRSLFPQEYQHKLETIFDGIDTRLWRPTPVSPGGPRQIAKREIPAGMKVVTYVSRGFESMRGFDVFMRVAKRLSELRRDVLFVCVGSDRICYGGDAKSIREKSFRAHVLAQDQYDLERFIFTGLVPPRELARILNLSDLHIYLTVPFVLSWSLMNALACGCTVLASNTAPVREMIEHGKNGLLADFYDVDGLVRLASEVLDDPRAFRSLGEAGVEMIQAKYSLPVTLPKMLDLYRRTLAGRAGMTTRTGEVEPSAPVFGVKECGGIAALARRHRWPIEVPPEVPKEQDKLPELPLAMLRRVLREGAELVVDVGAGLGLSTRLIAQCAPRANIVAVDPWDNGIEPYTGAGHPMSKVSFEAFAAHCWEFRPRIIPLRMTGADGLREVTRHELRPDVIHVNADGRLAASVRPSIDAACRLFPDAVLVGNGWTQENVRKAVTELVENDFYELEILEDAWRIWKE